MRWGLCGALGMFADFFKKNMFWKKAKFFGKKIKKKKNSISVRVCKDLNA